MKVLVTGGAGYIGSVLSRSLVSSGHTVRCLDQKAADLNLTLDLPMRRAGCYEGLLGDLRNEDDLKSALRGVGAVVHLAAIVGYPACDAAPDEAWSVNVKATQMLVRALPPGMPLIYLSTYNVYGSAQSDILCEEGPVRPLTLYGETKLCSEHLVLEQDGVVLRPTTAFGPSPHFREDLIVHMFARLGLSGQRLALFEPQAVRSFVHVADIARAIVFALCHSRTMAGQIYNVGSENGTLTKIDLAEQISALTGLEITFDRSGYDPDGRCNLVSFERIERLGFRTAFSFANGLRQTVHWMRSRLPGREGLR